MRNRRSPSRPLPEDLPPARTVSERERRFIEAYMGEAAGNATKAARLARYSAKTARKQGSRLLTKGHIRAAIEARTNQDPAVWSRSERQQFWTAIASGGVGFRKATLRDRLKASELLGRSQADFVERIEHAVGGSLLELLAAAAHGDRS